MRDERKGKLLVRFRAVCQDLTTVSGVLGFQEVAGSAESIALATGEIITRFCQPFREPPRGSKVQEHPMDQDLVQKMKDKVTIVVNDAVHLKHNFRTWARNRSRVRGPANRFNVPSVKWNRTSLWHQWFYKTSCCVSILWRQVGKDVWANMPPCGSRAPFAAPRIAPATARTSLRTNS